VSYRDDGSYLLRLEVAVIKDTSQSEGWRQETARMTRQLALRLLEADKSKQMFGKTKGGNARSAPVVKQVVK
jgi:hypothetical protein